MQVFDGSDSRGTLQVAGTGGALWVGVSRNETKDRETTMSASTKINYSAATASIRNLTGIAVELGPDEGEPGMVTDISMPRALCDTAVTALRGMGFEASAARDNEDPSQHWLYVRIPVSPATYRVRNTRTGDTLPRAYRTLRGAERACAARGHRAQGWRVQTEDGALAVRPDGTCI